MSRRTSTGFRGSLRQLYAITDGRTRREIGWLLLLTGAGAIAEIVTIASVVPFLALLALGSSGPHRDLGDSVFALVGANSPQQQLAAAAALLAAAAVMSAALRLLLERKTQDFVYSFGHRVSVEVQRRMLLQPYSWHVRQNSSQQLAIIEKVEIVTAAVLLPLVQSAAVATIALLVVLLLLRIAPGATLAAAAIIGIVYYSLATFARDRLNFYSEEMDRAFERRIRILQEALAGVRDIILDGSQEILLDRFRIIDSRLAKARANVVFVSSVPRYLVECAGIITIAGLALVFSGRPGGLVAAIPLLGALALGAQRLLPLVQQLYQGWSNVTANSALIDDVVRSLRLPLPRVEASAARLPFRRSIQFRNVSYAYPYRTRPAVSNVSFEIPHGSRVALVGPTGSGKSTTADLLMGLLEPTEGSIAVDGVPLSETDRQSWRANVAHVPQILFVADATIAENIALGSEVDVERVREAASLAQLDEFVSVLPDGFETIVGERGARISGGQRQRLAIARAIYRNTPLLVLDEATSALDDETEAAVLQALVRLQDQGRTVVIIAHRSSLISACDRVIRLEKGRIAEPAATTAKRSRSGRR